MTTKIVEMMVLRRKRRMMTWNFSKSRKLWNVRTQMLIRVNLSSKSKRKSLLVLSRGLSLQAIVNLQLLFWLKPKQVMLMTMMWFLIWATKSHTCKESAVNSNNRNNQSFLILIMWKWEVEKPPYQPWTTIISRCHNKIQGLDRHPLHRTGVVFSLKSPNSNSRLLLIQMLSRSL